jgi:hypothetical protein
MDPEKSIGPFLYTLIIYSLSLSLSLSLSSWVATVIFLTTLTERSEIHKKLSNIALCCQYDSEVTAEEGRRKRRLDAEEVRRGTRFKQR